MKFSKKAHKLFTKNQHNLNLKKHPNADVSRNGSIYFAVGLLLMLLVAYNAINYKTYEKSNIYLGVLDMDKIEEIDAVLIKDVIPPPPPPPPATIPLEIEIIDDEKDIIESKVAHTETDETDEILEIDEIIVVEVPDEPEIPIDFIQNVPIFPGCEKGSNAAKRKCMSQKISKFVQKKFNTNLAESIGLTGKQKIYVTFKISKQGHIIGVKSRAPHPRLQTEAARVINLLPKMKPGIQNGKEVIVSYSLPIIFVVQD
ncbi:MAG: energy transducer TonB [Bacteroidetes bacterium]|nr:energy transducer TonB [Bacteroidota bacterium]